jgi:hypothetical protein
VNVDGELTYLYNQKIMEYYHHRGTCVHDSVIKYVLEQKNLENAIKIATFSHDQFGNKHGHQRRLQNSVLISFGKELIEIKDKIHNAIDFDDLITIINSHKIFGVGEMLVYDTALRIGQYINKAPQKIYLHRGTRIGVENLINRKIDKKFILKEHLPEPFKSCVLTPSQLEDFFCIYKSIFKGNKHIKIQYC